MKLRSIINTNPQAAIKYRHAALLAKRSFVGWLSMFYRVALGQFDPIINSAVDGWVVTVGLTSKN